MPVSIRVGGVWKESTPWQRVGGVWKQMDQAGIRTGGAWKDTLASGPTVTIRADGANHSRFGLPTYAGVQFNLSGTEYEYAVNASLFGATPWLLTGNASEVWVMWTRTGGTEADWNSVGAGQNNVRLNLATTRSFRIWDSAGIGGTKTIIGYFRMYDAASGGNLLYTSPTVQWGVWYEPDVCPRCCFTPDTRITMATETKPIGDVKVGDMILTARGPEAVTGIIERENRKMHTVEFDDGRILKMSDDHPLLTLFKGWASINPDPNVSYKDLGVPAVLREGDVVKASDGKYHRITHITDLDFPETVYTFENSQFYANGLLVY